MDVDYDSDLDSDLSAPLSQYFISDRPSTSSDRPCYFDEPPPDTEECDEEECGRPADWICVQCSELGFCNVCWDKQISHEARARSGKKRKGANPVPHEQVPREVYHRMDRIFNQHMHGYDRAKLHEWEAGAKWFGVARNPEGQFCFRNTDRFTNIMGQSLSPEYLEHPLEYPEQFPTEQFPSVVSFIGETEAGKSTLIAMLLALQRSRTGRKGDGLLPISGDSLDPRPTTGDVQLFPDPRTAGTKVPILFADCEGLGGADLTPKGLEHESANPPMRKRDRLRHLAWSGLAGGAKCKTKGRTREEVVMQLFPKLLYTFSDTVVFVLKQARTLASVASKHLIPWAEASMETSLNQAVKPHLIIAVNAVNRNQTEAEWETDVTTATHMNVLNTEFSDNPALQTIADQLFLAGGPKIETVGGLIRYYYTSVTVVRFPVAPYYARLDRQLNKLYTEIYQKSRESYDQKNNLRMALSGDRMERLLSSAFDRFSEDIDTPFDFLDEALRQNPIIKTFAGHILQFILAFRKASRCPEIKNGSDTLFRALVPLVSSSLLLVSERDGLLGNARHLLEVRYIEHLRQAFDTFCDTWLPCTYERRGQRCHNFKSTHSKGHQSHDGKVIGTSVFENCFDRDAFFPVWTDAIGDGMSDLQEELARRSQDEPGLSRHATAASMHRNELNKAISSANIDSADLVSHQVCLFCLQAKMPENPLNCGHVLCNDCVETFGDRGTREAPELVFKTNCPFHPVDKKGKKGREDGTWYGFRSAASGRLTQKTRPSQPMKRLLVEKDREDTKIRAKPPHAGARVLCLDGGGIRGIMQLVILNRIEKEFGGRLKIQSFFDLVVGTSTGGIVALGLFVKNRSSEECIRDFKALCPAAFSPREFKSFPLVGRMAVLSHGSVYKTRPLEAALQKNFGKDDALFGGVTEEARPLAKVAVVTTETAGRMHPAILANYNRPQDETERTHYDFVREETVGSDLKIWEAARATSAAFPYFKSFVKPETGRDFCDGGFFYNCPAKIANSERRLIWGDVRDLHPDLMLSLGTGRRSQRPRLPRKQTNGQAAGREFVLSKAWKVGADLLEDRLECQRAWDDMVRESTESCRNDPELTGRYVRINVGIPGQVPRLDRVDRVEELEALTTESDIPEITEVAHRLIASCFYCQFWPGSGRAQLIGDIRCRFEDGSSEMEDLGNFLRSCIRLEKSFKPHFLVQHDSDPPVGARWHTSPSDLRFPINMEVIDGMCRGGRFSVLYPITIDSPSTKIRISLRLQEKKYMLYDSQYLSISGFPRAVSIEEVAKEARMRRVPAPVVDLVRSRVATPPPRG